MTGLDGRPYTLKDFDGSWAVIDFRGTWCTSCIKEMPDINRFSNEITTGKHKGIQFLSIVCYDNV